MRRRGGRPAGAADGAGLSAGERGACQPGLGPAARVLVFNTEGATDGVNYARQMALPDVPPAQCAFGFAPPLPGSH